MPRSKGEWSARRRAGDGEGAMKDRELLRMAAFKLQEAARRMKGLAREATTPETRTRLDAIAHELCDREAQLWELSAEGHGDLPPPASRERVLRARKPSRGAAN
jgi:hypothetical protein